MSAGFAACASPFAAAPSCPRPSLSHPLAPSSSLTLDAASHNQHRHRQQQQQQQKQHFDPQAFSAWSWDPSTGLPSEPDPFLWHVAAAVTGPDSTFTLPSDVPAVAPYPTSNSPSGPCLLPSAYSYPTLPCDALPSQLSPDESWQTAMTSPMGQSAVSDIDTNFCSTTPLSQPSSLNTNSQEHRAEENIIDQDEVKHPIKRKRGRPRTYPDVDPNEPFITVTRLPRKPQKDSRSSADKASPSPHTNGDRSAPEASDHEPTKDPKRQRNRAAATRYRHRIQSQIQELEAEAEAAATQRQSLVVCLEKLREELFLLKNQLLEHSGCNCPMIQSHLSREVSSLWGSLAERSSSVMLPG